MRRSAVLAFGYLLCCGHASADPRQDVLDAAARCNAISDYRTWLDCYYGAAQPLRVILGLPAAPAGQLKLVPPAAPVSVPLASAAPAQAAVDLRHSPPSDGSYTPAQPMASYSFDSDGRFTVTLANGEVWKQIKEDSIFARWKAAAESYRASVVSGIFGSHMMHVSDGQSYRVARLR